jgi:MFS family permease
MASKTNSFRFLGLSAYWFATSLKWFILFFLTPDLVNGLVPGGEKNSMWGLIVAIGAAEAMIGPAVMGWLSDRTRTRFGQRRPYLALGAALTAISLIAMGQAQSYIGLMISYLLIQISDDIGTGPYSSAIPELVPEDQRGSASGSMGFLQLGGQVIAAVIGLAFGSSPTTIFLLLACINVLCALSSIGSITTLERERPAKVEMAQETEKSNLWSSLKNDDFRWVWLTRFLNAVGFYVILNYLLNYLTDVVKVFDLGFVKFAEPFEAVIAIAVALSLSGAVSALFCGKRCDKVGRKRVVQEAGWIMFVPLVAFCFISNYSLLFPIAMVFGIGYGAYLSADWAVVSDVLPNKHNLARDMGVWQMSIAAPQLVSGGIGFLIDKGNHWQAGRGYQIAFLIAGFVMLMGSLLITKVKGST